MNKEQPKTAALACYSFVFPDTARILDEPDNEECVRLRKAVAMCVSLVRSGNGVCVNCSAGVNRSSLVVALAARQLLPHVTMAEPIQLLRDAKQARCRAWQTFDGESGQAFERFCLHQSVGGPDDGTSATKIELEWGSSASACARASADRLTIGGVVYSSQTQCYALLLSLHYMMDNHGGPI